MYPGYPRPIRIRIEGDWVSGAALKYYQGSL
jgi:hypothetical protein